MESNNRSPYGGRVFLIAAVAIGILLLLILGYQYWQGTQTTPTPIPPTETFPPPPATYTVTPTPTATPTVEPPEPEITATATAPATITAPAASPEPVATATATPEPTATPFMIDSAQIGWASYYEEGVFARVMEAHREFAKYPADIAPSQAAAVADCRWKRDGRELMVRPLNAETDEPTGEWIHLYIVDCAGKDSHEWMAAHNIVIEIDESLWLEWATYRHPGLGLRVEIVLLQ